MKYHENLQIFFSFLGDLDPDNDDDNIPLYMRGASGSSPRGGNIRDQSNGYGNMGSSETASAGI